jgi:uncharacterized protein YjiS (DUF1127 family)
MTKFLWRVERRYNTLNIEDFQTCINTIGKPMSQAETIALAHRPPPLSRLLVTLALTVAAWELRHRTRKSLARMSTEQLSDIGCDASLARVEAAKPFWRA